MAHCNHTTLFKPKAVIAFLFLMLFTLIAKILPHTPNFSPELVFMLFAGTLFSKRILIFIIILIAFAADCTYAILLKEPVLGDFSWFTYSGFIFIGYFAHWFQIRSYRITFLYAALSTTFIFWLWTNLGIWTLNSYYPHTIAGLLNCYTLALPFLYTSMLSSMVWSLFTLLGQKKFTSQTPLTLKG